MSGQRFEASVTQQVKFDAICMQFEQAWRQDQKPTIESFLDGLPEGGRPLLLSQLLLLELEYMERAGTSPVVDEYLDRFPDEQSAVRRAFEEHASAVSSESEGDKLNGTLEQHPVTEQPGSQIGRYRLLEQIGEGGMGVVYMAEQQRPVRRKVALKVIKPGMDTKQVIARFEAERQALAIMDHVNIARVMDAGSTESGRPYFVMELVRGIPITEYCDQNKLPTDDRLKLFVSVCQAVQHAHQKGIIHRDIKPTNVLVTLHDGVPVPKIIDFGVAKATNQQLTERTLFTAFAQMVGTPLYMSPEQAEMSGLDVDTRSDIYSLGVLLYELLTGATPFDKKRISTAAYDEIRRIIREEEPLKPSTRISSLGEASRLVCDQRNTDSHKLRQRLVGELDWIVMKSLEKDRTRRYQTARGLAADVTRHLSGEAVEACPPTLTYRLGKLCNRYRLQASVAALFLLLLVGSTVVAWLLYADARSARNQAEYAKAGLEKERDRAIQAERDAENNYQEARNESTRAEEERRRADRHANELSERLYDYNLVKAHAAYRDDDTVSTVQLLNDCLEEQRGWEWHRLWRLASDDLVAQFEIPSAEITTFDLAPDASRIAVGDVEGTVWLLDAGDGEVIWKYPTGKPFVLDVKVSPDGKLIGISQVDRGLRRNLPPRSDTAGALQIRATDSGRVLWETSRKSGEMFGLLEFSPDSSQLVVAAGELATVKGSMQLYDALTGEQVWSAPTAGIAMSFVFSPDGQRVHFSAWSDGRPSPPSTLACWNVRDHSTVWSVARQTGSEICLNRDGTRLISGGANHSLQIWDASSGEQIEELHSDLTDPAIGLALSRDGQYLLSDGTENAVVWDYPAKEVQRRFSANGSSLEFTSNGRQFLTVDRGNRIQFKELLVLPPVLTLSGHEDSCRCVEFSPDGEELASASMDGTLRTWNTVTGQEMRTDVVSPEYTAAVTYSADGKYLATGGSDGAKLWLAKSRRLVHHWPQIGPVYWLRFSPDGQHIAAGGGANEVNVWTVADGRSLLTSRGTTDQHIEGLEFGLDSDAMMVLHNRGATELLSIEAGSESAQELRGRLELVSARCLVRRPDTNVIAAGILETVEFWDIDSSQKLRTIRNGATVKSLTFNADGSRLFVGDSSGRVNVWNIESGEQLFSFKAHEGNVWSLDLSPDGSTLATAGHDELIKLWETARPDHTVADARRVVGAATAKVNALYRRSGSLRDVMAALTSDETLGKDELQSAIELANARGDRPSGPRILTSTESHDRITAGDVYQNVRRTQRMLIDLVEVESGISVQEGRPQELAPDSADNWFRAAAELADGEGMSREEQELLLSPLVETHPSAHHFVYIRGLARAQRGEWREAERDLTAALGRVPEKSQNWHWQACQLAMLYVWLCDLDQYHQLCNRMVADFGDTDDPLLVERTTKMCLLPPESRVDVERVAAMFDGVEDPEVANVWFTLAKAIAEYRCGRWESARKHVDRLVGIPEVRVMAACYESMCLMKSGEPAKADQALRKAEDVLQSATYPKLGGDSFQKYWHEWINSQIAYREAVTIVRGATKDDS